jgi:hypothetical protein
MAELYISYVNSIRWRPAGGNNTMPRIDKMENGVQYYDGVYPLPNYKADWLLGEEMKIQFQVTLPGQASGNVKIKVVTPTGIVNVNPTIVTPSGWLVNGSSGQVLNYSYTPTVEGDYYMYTSSPDTDTNYISDVFRVHSNDNNLIEIRYSDSKNSFDGVFYDNSTLIWEPKAYFTGIAIVKRLLM